MFLKKGNRGVIILVAASCAAIVSVLVSLAIITGTFSLIHGGPKAEAIADRNQKDIEHEFHQIAPLSRVTVIQPGSMRWTDHGIVSAAYKTKDSYESIKLHYYNELTSRGWNLRREEDIKYDRNDYGGKELIFCKSGYVAHVQYAGRQETEFGWTCSFAMTWGPSDECR